MPGLSLTRSMDEPIVITLEDGRQIVISHAGVRRHGRWADGRVRINIEAPRTIQIDRGEVVRDTNAAEGAADSGS